MQVENHKEEVPFSHYEELYGNLDPMAAMERINGLKWDGKEFRVCLLGREFAISHPVYAIRALDGGAIPPLPTQTFLLRYLLEGKTVAAMGNWLTFREMPWGELYIKPYTGRVLTRAAFTLGTRLDAFRKAAEKMLPVVRQCLAISTLSNTVWLFHRRMFWNVRAMPSLVILSGVGASTWLYIPAF